MRALGPIAVFERHHRSPIAETLSTIKIKRSIRIVV